EIEEDVYRPPFHLRRTTVTQLAVEAQQYTKAVEIPKQYEKFAKVVSEEESQRFPPKRIWDHAIDLVKDTPEVLNCKVYPLNQEDDAALQGWIDEQLAKGYI